VYESWRPVKQPRYENSSSAAPTTQMSHGAVRRSCTSDAMAHIIAAKPALVSHDPRPYNLPPVTSGSNA
jgi:hypothetical protein